MAKAIPKNGSRGRISSHKSIRKIPKGVIHIQASFNNTIVTVTDVRVRVVSWCRKQNGKTIANYWRKMAIK